MTVFFIGYVIASAFVFLYLDHQHRKERKELYDRIMSRDIAQYNAIQSGHTEKKEGTNYLYNSLEKAQRRQTD